MNEIEQFVDKHIKKVEMYAKRYYRKYDNALSYEDLYQSGVLGLMKGYHNNTKNIYKTIENEIIMEIIKHGYPMRVSNKVFFIYHELLDDSYEQIGAELTNHQRYEKLIEKIGTKEKIYYPYHFILDANAFFHPSPYTLAYQYDMTHNLHIQDLKKELDYILSLLSDDCRNIIEMLYGYENGIVKNYSEIAYDLGISNSQVVSLERKAMRDFRLLNVKEMISKDILSYYDL